MRHVTCGKPLTVFSFAVITQLPKNLIWCAGRMAQQVKKHMLLFQMSWLWFPAPMLGSPLQGDLMPSLGIWVHLDSHAHTHTETRTNIHIVLKKIHLKKKTHLESKIFFTEPLRIRYNCAQISWLQRAEAELSMGTGRLCCWLMSTWYKLASSERRTLKMPHQNWNWAVGRLKGIFLITYW